jgi:hypothetical protein
LAKTSSRDTALNFQQVDVRRSRGCSRPTALAAESGGDDSPGRFLDLGEVLGTFE